ncbi:Sel1 repeat protein [Caballeronia pedi]|uniref:Sel1 repeat protein n=1 Tax=Caballeronia pedi TaxID=1777141 RepID=A0A157ZV06_9BURK|nr:SEL1-like repeat protein [Caballeronia pedi]SAK49296.1 Sel1 repeat protein [Caballeronia pedi]
MENIGYVFAFANSALLGVVHVGNTKRSPTERAMELSNAMGMSSPFIVAYAQLFEDCEEGERFVRSQLKRKGYQGAELIQAPVTEAVKAILRAPGALNEQDLDTSSPEHSWPDAEKDDALESLQIQPWTDVFEEALGHYYGTGSHLEDRAEAYRLFQKAASLGCPSAYSFLGTMNRYGSGVRENEKKALEYLKEGARIGSVVCYFEMADFFIHAGHRENAEKCASLFVEKFSHQIVDGVFLTDSEVDKIHSACAFLVYHKLRNGIVIPPSLRGFMAGNASYLKDSSQEFLKLSMQHSDESAVSTWRDAVDLIDSLLLNSEVLAA